MSCKLKKKLYYCLFLWFLLYSSVSPCVQTPKPSQNPIGQERVCCRYNTSLFAIGFDDVFFFHTPHSSGISKTFRLTKLGTISKVNVYHRHTYALTIYVTQAQAQAMSTLDFHIEDADADWNLYQLDDTPPPSLLISDLFRLHEQECSVSVKMTTLPVTGHCKLTRETCFLGGRSISSIMTSSFLSKRPTFFFQENVAILRVGNFIWTQILLNILAMTVLKRLLFLKSSLRFLEVES